MRNRTSNEQWLTLLADAIKNGEKLQTNYRWEYKGKKLGGFLMRVNRGNNDGLKAIVASMGVDFKMHSKNPNDYVDRYCDELLACENPKALKTRFQTRFNLYILRRREKVHTEKVRKLNKVWRQVYKERRTWHKALTTTNRIELWKKYRYNVGINPEGKWFQPLTKMKELYSFAFQNKRQPEKMERIRAFFSEKEQEELTKEGYFKREK